jgi:serine protease Do
VFVKLNAKRVVLPLISILCLAQAPAFSQPIDAKLFAERNSFVALAGRVTPSVVNIDVIKRSTSAAADLPFDDPTFRRFFGEVPEPEREREVSGSGSGVIISADGLILTNNHVVSGASDIEVTLQDGRQLKARLLGLDPSTDVAVLKVESSTPLPAALIGSSESLPIGSWLMAVGNPYGLEETVTVGILSGKGREIGVGIYDDFLQTDAAINPGNSGGGLFNSEGQLVGINTAVAGQGIGFAIPIEMAQRVANELQARGKVQRGYLGVAIQDLTPSLREALRLPPEVKGALLGQVLAGGPAAKGGLQPGDVVVEFEGHPIANQKALLARVAQARVGSTAQLKVWRRGRTESLSTAIAERPSEVAEAAPRPAAATSKTAGSGFSAVNLTPELARRLGLPQSTGVVIQQVRQGSPAARAGLRAGDVITQANGQAISSMEDLDRVLLQTEKAIALLVTRGQRQLFLALPRST